MNTGNDKNSNKRYYTIGEVSEITKVKQTVLRFWETEFTDLMPKKNKFGHRAYTGDDIAVIENIKSLLYSKGLTIKGAKNYLDETNTNEKLYEKDMNIKNIKKELIEILSLLKGKK
jgi:DNA-binding transcriptional MerR regulator